MSEKLSVSSKDDRKKKKKDPIRPWFRAAEDLGDHIGIRFGRLAPKTNTPEWYYRSHAEYDGIGGFASILREKGVRIESLPEMPHPAPLSWKPFLRSVPEYFQPRDKVEWKKRFPSTRPAKSDSPPEAVAWQVFDEAETAKIRDSCRKAGYTVNSFLIKHISEAIAPSLAECSETIPWMIPVNLRGKVTRSSDMENHSSYVRLIVRRGDSIADIHRNVYAALKKGTHWASWMAYSAGVCLPKPLKRAMIKADRATSQWVIGAFSNLGEWDKNGLFEGRDIDGDWLFMPPAMRFFKIAAGCITYRGRLSLCMHLHPELSTDIADAKRWMESWTASIRAGIAGHQ